MRQDKILARILLIFSVANIALAAPTVVRQRHLDVARAASPKRGPNSDNEETGDILPESSSAAANRIATQESGPPVSGNGAMGDIPPESSSHMSPHDGLTNGWAESSSAAANRITTQASGPPVSGNGAMGDIPPESSSHMPPHDGLTNGWAESSSAANRITTQASRPLVLGNGAMGNSPLESSSHMPPHDGLTNGWAESSSAANRITAQASGPPVSGNGAMGDSPLESSSHMPPHDGLTNGWAESSSAGANRLTPLAPGPPIWDNEAMGDLRPQPLSRLNGWMYWLNRVSLPESVLRVANLILTHAPGSPVSGSSSAALDRITTQAPGATSSSSSDSGHLGDLPPPPHQDSAPESLAAPEADGLVRNALTHKILLYSGVAGVIGGTAAFAYGIHKWVNKHRYVSPLSPADI